MSPTSFWSFILKSLLCSRNIWTELDWIGLNDALKYILSQELIAPRSD
jgi:hypothetical protein